MIRAFTDPTNEKFDSQQNISRLQLYIITGATQMILIYVFSKFQAIFDLSSPSTSCL